MAMEAMRARRQERRTVRHGTTSRARGPAARILELQAAAGNRAVTGILVQRRGASGLLDKQLALTSPTPQVIDDELVPIGEAPGRFDGFAKRDDALALAGRSKEVAVVVNDGKHYHVLRTTAATLGGTTAAAEAAQGLDGGQGGRAHECPDGQAVPNRLRRRQVAVRQGPRGGVPATARPEHAPGVRPDRRGRRTRTPTPKARSTSPPGSTSPAATCPPRSCRRDRTRCRRRRS